MKTAADVDREPFQFRAFPTDALELRHVEQTGTVVVTGSAVPFNVPSHELSTSEGRFVEVVSPSAFNVKDPNRRRVAARFAHLPSCVLGNERSGTLRLHQGPDALRFELQLPATQLGRDVAALVSRGDVCGCSIGMVVTRDRWSRDATQRVVRRVEALDLFEVSLTDAPVYSQTAVALEARSRDAFEELLKVAPTRLNGRRLELARATLARVRAGGAFTAASR